MAFDFAYSARRIDGSTSAGVLSADSLQEARQKLKQQGLFVLGLTSSARSFAAEAVASPNVATPGRRRFRVPRSEIMLLTSQLAIMTQSGVDLADGISNLATTTTNLSLQDVLRCVHSSLEGGVQLSAALKQYPTIFDEVFISSIRAGEASGRMTQVLQRLSSMLRNEDRMRSAIQGSLAYPAVLLGISFFVLLAVIFIVLPQFSQVFKDIGVVPPASTALLMTVGAALREHPLMLAGGSLVGAAGLFQFWRTSLCHRWLDYVWLNSILTRSAARCLSAGRVCRLLGMMLSAGIPLLESLQLCSRSVSSRQYRALMDELQSEVTLGHMMGPVLTRCPVLPPGAAQMVVTAERSGKLSDVFDLIGTHYEDEGERQLRDRVKLLEPAVIVVMGVLVGFIVASVMLPLFEFSSASSHR